MTHSQEAMHIAYIALGSNLDNPIYQIKTAFDELNTLSMTCLLARSSLYQTAPEGHADQPDFINAVAKIHTALMPEVLLKELLKIEACHHRVRDPALRNRPRTLDLDILLFDALEYQSPVLTLPHPRLHQRLFVLLPLVEIAPDLILPNGTSIKQLLNEVF